MWTNRACCCASTPRLVARFLIPYQFVQQKRYCWLRGCEYYDEFRNIWDESFGPVQMGYPDSAASQTAAIQAALAAGGGSVTVDGRPFPLSNSSGHNAPFTPVSFGEPFVMESRSRLCIAGKNASCYNPNTVTVSRQTACAICPDDPFTSFTLPVGSAWDYIPFTRCVAPFAGASDVWSYVDVGTSTVTVQTPGANITEGEWNNRTVNMYGRAITNGSIVTVTWAAASVSGSLGGETKTYLEISPLTPPESSLSMVGSYANWAMIISASAGSCRYGGLGGDGTHDRLCSNGSHVHPCNDVSQPCAGFVDTQYSRTISVQQW